MNSQQEYIQRSIHLKKDLLILVIKILVFIPITYTLIEYESYYNDKRVLQRLVYALNVFLSSNIIISTVRIILLSWYKRRSLYFHTSSRGSFVLGINRIASVLNAVVIIFSLMLAFGINPRDFLTSITIVAAAIALIFKDYITNMISGLIIMFSDQLTLGDYVKIGEYQGQIIDITLVNIVINNDDDDIVMVPNNFVFTTNIVNQSFQNSRKVSVEFELAINHTMDREDLKKRLNDLLNKHSNEVLENSMKLKVLAVQKDVVKYKVQFTLTNLGKTQSQFIKNIVLNEVLKIGN
ncbi:MULTISPECIES: mechanosensitive ion channel family protein [Olivibacter]|uniref:MscS Mechanosensitive ion channel n=3 Tax=Sphingobacteriaceae TaxID=84566 RepID=F4C2A4_SPHS2|nr:MULTISPECIES: mechanosensitive ion channel domain-containing protein [Olivibacter]MDM8175295.1 mechanosensitive ion channel [Olivibacter sp. 47]QEL02061.1 mechanosensitive ion channel [Olivibacter sp. LS-1]